MEHEDGHTSSAAKYCTHYHHHQPMEQSYCFTDMVRHDTHVIITTRGMMQQDDYDGYAEVKKALAGVCLVTTGEHECV